MLDQKKIRAFHIHWNVKKKMFSNIPENLNVQYAKTPLRKQNLITVNAIDKNKSEKNIWGCSLIWYQQPYYVGLHFLPVYLDIQCKDRLQIGWIYDKFKTVPLGISAVNCDVKYDMA